jgi:nicotinate-nucleotide adenylyltransferase
VDLAAKTVLYGGSFNPPHLAHQMACLYFLEGLGAAAVWLLPAFVHPFGKQLAPFAHRVAMSRLLAAPFGERVVVSEVEAELGGAGRTYDTVRHLVSSHPERSFALAVGADILGEVHKWYRWAELEALVPIVIVGRAGYPAKERAGIELPAIASTELRVRAARGESLQGLVPQSVADYIRAHDLYR